jgi:hypothetical protein
MTGAVSSKEYLKPVKLFIVWMSRRIDVQWIGTIKVVLEPMSRSFVLSPQLFISPLKHYL